MALLPVTTYGAGWNPTTNQGRVFIQIGTGPAQPIAVTTPEEFIILLLMMRENGVQIDAQTREIEIPFRPVGT